jgi:hypothetical protein
MNAVKALAVDEPAADHLATIDRQHGAWSDKKGKYSRQHTRVLAAVTPVAYSDNTPIDRKRLSVHRVGLGISCAPQTYLDLTPRKYNDLKSANGQIDESTNVCAEFLRQSFGLSSS